LASQFRELFFKLAIRQLEHFNLLARFFKGRGMLETLSFKGRSMLETLSPKGRSMLETFSFEGGGEDLI
jgi:hypothetical protein